MKAINPYIGFNGKCREAMTFYQQCMGGGLEMQEVNGSPMEKFWQGPKDQIFHSSLTINGQQLIMGSDMTDQTGYTKGTDVALAMTCSTEEEIQVLFAALSEGGKVLQELKLQFWGAMFGSLQDPFGIKWMLNYSK
jgi:PhnB protein